MFGPEKVRMSISRPALAVRELAELSRRFHLVATAIVAPPLVMLFAWLAFPFLERWNFGYSIFHFACVISFFFAAYGFTAWLIEGRFRRAGVNWIGAFILLVEAIGALFIRAFGDFYWAFERGYFLD